MLRRTRRPNLQYLEHRLVPANFVVTSNADSGPGTLRDVLSDAQTNGENDVISFDMAKITSPLQISNGQLVYAATEGHDLTIAGPGANVLTLQSIMPPTITNRIFNLSDGSLTTNSINITISGLTITGGNILGAANNGGGIFVTNESLTLDSVVITGNSTAADGGAVSQSSTGKITVLNSVISNNQATASASQGGGLHFSAGAQSELIVDRSTISGNKSGGDGGGIYFASAGGRFTITNSTVSGNQAGTVSSSVGGGLRFSGNTGAPSVIRNSTFSGNIANKGSGGGFAWVATATTGVIAIQNCTFTLNKSSSTTNGGAISRTSTGGTLNIESCVIAQNSDVANTAQTDLNFSAAATIGPGYNFIGVGDKGNFTLVGSNIFGTQAAPADAKLGPLANNMGATLTHFPLSGSPLCNRGNNSSGLLTDQRGTGFDRVLDSFADIGAVEATDSIPSARFTPTAKIIAVGPIPNTIEMTYIDDGSIDVATIDVSDITVTAPNASKLTINSVAVDVGTNGSPRKATYTFSPPGGAWDGADNGTFVVALNAGQVLDTGAAAVPAGMVGSFQVQAPLLFTVDEPTDIEDGNYAAGKLSLREAISLANKSSSSADVIAFDATVFAAPLTINNATEMTITDALTINAPPALLTLDAKNLARHFNINGTGIFAVSIADMQLTNGQGSSSGGSIAVQDESLTLTGMRLINNATASSGGAIAIGSGGALTLTECVFQQNFANGLPGNGGAVYMNTAASVLSAERCAFIGNEAFDGGGAIFARGSLTLRDSTLSGNAARFTPNSSGGGIYFAGVVGAGGFTIRNSTISGNVALNHGGGLFFADGSFGTALIHNTTVTLNKADGVTTALGDGGGGIARADAGTGLISLQSTIVAQNISANNFKDLSTAGGVDAENSLIGVWNTGIAMPNNVGGTSLTGTLAVPLDAKLAALSNKGGPTSTHALLSGSPAIDKGSNPAPVLSFDQRGAGFTRNANGVDIGAFEVQSAAPPPTITMVVVNDGSAQRSRVTSLKVGFSQVVSLPGVATDAFSLKRNVTNDVVHLAAVVDNSGTETFVTLTFTSGAVDFGSLADGRYTLTVWATKVSNVNGSLDGNGNGTGGDDYVLVGDPAITPKLFRLFGDSDGDNDVDTADFAAFRVLFSSGTSMFDYDNDGDTDAGDFGQFRLRFGSTV